jgi:2-keto-myo-inositol isomerase
MRFALNRTVAPTLSLDAFLSLAAQAGAEAVEVRNDVPGREFADGTPAKALAEAIGAAGLKVASINALQRFNDWTQEREREARALIRYAADLGAPGVVMCPVIDANHGWSAAELEAKLLEALRALKPIYAEHGVTGYVEPLGMVDSTLRHQAPAVAAIGDVDGFAQFALCYDTFQYYRSRDADLLAAYVGLVHISGITRRNVEREALVEPDRGLVDAGDICGNIDQLNRMLAAGYDGFVSVEPFDPAVQADPDIGQKLAASLAYVRETVSR